MIREIEAGKRRFSIAFLAPAFIVYTALIIIPLLFSFYYSTVKWNGVGAQVFVAFGNYTRLFKNEEFWITLTNTAKLVGVSLAFQVPLALIFSFMIYRVSRGYKVFRACLFLPVVISPIAIGFMFLIFYNSELGMLNRLLEMAGLGMLQREWLSDKDVLLYAVMAPQVWQFIGLHVIIIFAGLQSVPEEIFESAHMDGANAFQVFFRIVIPILWDIIQISIILCITGSLKSFAHPWIMTQGGPGVRSAYMTVLMFRMAFFERNFGMASAITVIIVILSLTVTVVLKRLLRRRDELSY